MLVFTCQRAWVAATAIAVKPPARGVAVARSAFPLAGKIDFLVADATTNFYDSCETPPVPRVGKRLETGGALLSYGEVIVCSAAYNRSAHSALRQAVIVAVEVLESRRMGSWLAEGLVTANDFLDEVGRDYFSRNDDVVGFSISAGDGDGAASAQGSGGGTAGSVSGAASTGGNAAARSWAVTSSDDANVNGPVSVDFDVDLDAGRALSGSGGASVDVTNGTGSAFASLGAGQPGSGSSADGTAHAPGAHASTLVHQAGSRADASWSREHQKADAKGIGNFQASADFGGTEVWASALDGAAETHGQYFEAFGGHTLFGTAEVNKANPQAGIPGWALSGQHNEAVAGGFMSSEGGNIAGCDTTVQGAQTVSGLTSTNILMNPNDGARANVGASATNMDAVASGLSILPTAGSASADVNLSKAGWSAIEDPGLPTQRAAGNASAFVNESDGNGRLVTNTELTATDGGSARVEGNGNVHWEDDSGAAREMRGGGSVSAITAANTESDANGALEVVANVGSQSLAVTHTGQAHQGVAGLRNGEATVDGNSSTTFDTGTGMDAAYGSVSGTARAGAADSDGASDGSVTLNSSKSAKTASVEVSASARGTGSAVYTGLTGSADPENGVRTSGRVEAQTSDVAAAPSGGSVDVSAGNGSVGVTADGSAAGGGAGENANSVRSSGNANSIFHPAGGVDAFGTIEITLSTLTLRVGGNSAINSASASVQIEQQSADDPAVFVTRAV